MFIIPVVFCIVIFYLLKDRLRLVSGKGLIVQLIICAVLALLFIANIFYNFGYYSGYSGPRDGDYELAITIVHFLEITLMASFIFLICSLISGYDKNSIGASLSEFRKIRKAKRRKLL